MADASLSQEEIEALLSGADAAGIEDTQPAEETITPASSNISPKQLENIEKIASTMAKAQAKALTDVTTKETSVAVISCTENPLSDTLSEIDGDFIFSKLNYTSPEVGNVFYVLKKNDSLLLTNLITGSEASDLDDMALSSIQEAFQQMLSSSDEAIQSEYKVTMSSLEPKFTVGSFPDNVTIPNGSYVTIKLAFKVESSEISVIQLWPTSLIQALTTVPDEPAQNEEVDMTNLFGESNLDSGIQNAEFSDLAQTQEPPTSGNINLLLDVPMDVTVELGRSSKTIQEVLSLGEGSIIELDKLAGEPVDLLVNGKPIAKGEVVVIDENFGVRVTEIVSPRQRLAPTQS